MAKSSLAVVFLCICILCCPESLLAQDKNAISAIPRVDVHSHIGSVERMEHYVKVAEALKDQYGIPSLLYAIKKAMAFNAVGADYIENILYQEMTPQHPHPPVKLHHVNFM